MKSLVEILVDDLAANTRAVYDLRQLSKNLPRQFSKLSRIIRKYLNAHSWSADIRISQEYIDDAIKWHKTRRSSMSHAKTALLHGAILGYARVFDTATSHRPDLKIGEKFDPEQMLFHSQLMELRNEALAHFGPKGTSKPWNEDLCIIVHEGITWQTAVIARRSQFELEFAENLKKHLAAVQAFTRADVLSLKEHLENELQTVRSQNDDFFEILNDFQVDPVSLGGWDGPILSNRRTDGIVIKIM